MMLLKRLNTREIIDMINDGGIGLSDLIKLENTPKKYLILCPEKSYATSDVMLTVKERIVKEYSDLSVNDILVIDVEQYNKEILNNENY